MCTGHDDTAGREEVARLSRRGFLRTTVTTAAVVGTSGALAGPAFAQEEASGQGRGRHRVPPDQISIQLYTLRDQLAVDLEGTLAALGAIGYTRVEHAGFVGRTVEEFKAALDAAGLAVDLGPRPHPPALRPGRLERLAGRRQHPGVALHRAPLLRDRLRHRRGDPDHGTLAGVRARSEPGRPHGPRRRAQVGLPQPQLGVLPPHRQPRTDRLRRPHRGHRPGPGPPGAGSVLGHPGSARPRRPHRAEHGAGSCSTTSRT